MQALMQGVETAATTAGRRIGAFLVTKRDLERHDHAFQVLRNTLFLGQDRRANGTEVRRDVRSSVD
jgi:hypothetical protein